MDFFLSLFFVLTVSGIFAFTIDDLILDLFALFHRVTPGKVNSLQEEQLARLPQIRIAILIANWKEEDVLERMITGNVAHIEYEHYNFFLGVYPNDIPTWEAARRLEQKFPQVSVVVNTKPGPTSKGQLLNEMMRQIFASEKESLLHYDAFLLHDSEDLIHPRSFQLINRELLYADFVQIPVFSLQTPYLELTAGTYADEFAESHTKALLVREKMGAAIPSAGVGTALSRRLILAIQQSLQGDFLNEKTLTEDYQLGIMAKRLGFKSVFACYYFLRDGSKDFIATREYFPNEIPASIRQKTRWTAGIAFQSSATLGWAGSFADRYFFWRDRKGPWNAVWIFLCVLLGIVVSLHQLTSGALPSVTHSTLFTSLLQINFAHMLWRIFERGRATAFIYGLRFAILTPIRWPLANIVNTIAAWKAYRSYSASVRNGRTMAWVKTQHRLPENFGQPLARPKLDKQEKEITA